MYESQASAARGIKQQIKRFVEEGTSTDDQIIEYIQTQFGTKTLLVPNASGFDALVWALPAFALVIAIAGLTVAFRRWKMAGNDAPTADDFALVSAAMHDEQHVNSSVEHDAGDMPESEPEPSHGS